MSDDDDDAGGAGQAAALNFIVLPLRKQLTKHGKTLSKLESTVNALEKERANMSEKQGGSSKVVTDLQTTMQILKGTLDSHPWRSEGDRYLSELRGVEKRLADTLDEQRVQLAAHSQVFQSTQSAVSTLSHEHASLKAEHNDGSRRALEELRGLTARLDHMRGEFAERVTHSFSEATAHADRQMQRLQQELLRVDQDVSERAQARHLGVLTRRTSHMQHM